MTVQQTLLAISALAIALIVASCVVVVVVAVRPHPLQPLILILIQNPSRMPHLGSPCANRSLISRYRSRVVPVTHSPYKARFRIKDLLRRPMLRVSRGRIASRYSNGAVAFVHSPTSDKASVHA